MSNRTARRVIQANELASRVNYNDPFAYNMRLDLATVTDNQSEDLLIGSDDFWVEDLQIHITDASGYKLQDREQAQNFLMQLKNEDGESYFNKPINLENLKNLVHSIRFKGWIFPARTKINVEVTGDGKPTSAVGTAPYNVYISFIGYRLLGIQ